MGAQLMSLRKGESEYLWQGDSIAAKDELPIPFPSLAFSQNGKAESAEGTILLPVMDLLVSTSLRLSSRALLATLQLKSTEGTRKSCPYDFELKLIFR